MTSPEEQKNLYKNLFPRTESKEKKAEGVFEEKQFKAVGKIRCYPDIECVVAESLDEKWRCLVPISSIKAKISVFGSIPVVNVILF